MYDVCPKVPQRTNKTNCRKNVMTIERVERFCAKCEQKRVDQINQATSWVMSKLSMRFGRRDVEAQTASELESPRSVILETIVNAVVHRDYNSKGCVQSGCDSE